MIHHLYAGYAQRSITPPLTAPVYLAGFDANRRADAIHDDLWVRALALAWGETRLVLACVDVIGLGRPHCREIEHRVYKKWGDWPVIVACTHTHHGPDTLGLWGPSTTRSGVDLNYLNHLKKVIADCCNDAIHVLSPVTLRAATAQVPNVVKNYRNPHIIDAELTCLQLVDREDQPFATLLIYPCHPEVLSRANTAITSDYADSLRRRVEDGAGAPAIFCVGALGGMLSPAAEERTFVASESMGETLAVAALAALAETEAHPVTHLAFTRREFTIPMTNPVFRMAVENGLLPAATFEPAGQVRTEAALLRLHTAAETTLITTVPGELLPRLGLTLKEQMRAAGAATAAIIGLANDELGYILPADEFIFPTDPFDPGDHYEETMSVGPEAGPRLMAVCAEMIQNT
ncbi:MAG: hypothetical protein KF893_15580 [Caldilineaceae bacterium]|nr:hypothetical protein [Caldilineaceae bacterium]